MNSQSAKNVQRPDGVKHTPFWREWNSFNHFIWASSASVGGYLEGELPQVKDAAPPSGLSSRLFTHHLLPGKSEQIYQLNLIFWCLWQWWRGAAVVAAAASFSVACWWNRACRPNLCIPPSPEGEIFATFAKSWLSFYLCLAGKQRGSYQRLMSGGCVNASPVSSASARRIPMVCALLNSVTDTHMDISQFSAAPMDRAPEIPQGKCLRTTAYFSHALLPEPKQDSKTQWQYFILHGTICIFPSHFIPCLQIFKM